MKIKIKTLIFIAFVVLLSFGISYCISIKKIFSPQINEETKIEPQKSENIKQAFSLQDAFISVAEKLKPAVVSISTVYTYEVEQPQFFFGDPFEDFFQDFFNFDVPRNRRRQPVPKRQYRAEGGGSGVIISEDGYILTNEHVIKDATEIRVIVNLDNKDKEFKGKVVGKDARTDLAVIKINGKNLPYANLGDSDKVKVGEFVIAIGSPFGLEQTVTFGIVSALRQSITIENRQYRDFIQTDAAINRGNSGGPLCDLNGNVIGINTAIYAPTGVFSGIGFAIPINRAKDILDQLITKGKVIRGWLGIEIGTVDDVIARQFGLKEKRGVLVNNVLKNTPAEKAGLKRGDIILEVKTKQKEVKVDTPTQLQDIIGSLPPKSKVEMKIFRDKKEQKIEVILGEMPQDINEVRKEEKQAKKDEVFSWLGYEFTDLDSETKEALKLDESVKGVLVSRINYDAKDYENIGLRERDVVVSLNQVEVTDIDTLKSAVKNVDIKKGIVFDIIRNGKPMFISFVKE